MANDQLVQVIEMEETVGAESSPPAHGKEGTNGYLRSAVHDPLDAAAET